jgi:DNA-binding GntR family transcriptional regulator
MARRVADATLTEVDGAPDNGGPAAGETLADFAYTRLRHRLITCAIRPGTTFSESEMAQSLRLGKTPIREAFLRLRLEGLIRVHSRTGYSAAPVTLKDARDICALRALLDGEAAFLAAGYPERAARALAEQDHAAGPANGDVTSVIEADGEFHVTVARATGNGRLEEALTNALLHFRRLSYLGLALDPAAPPPHPDHGELIGAIAAGDGPRARDLALREVRQAEQRLIQAFISSHSVASANVSIEPSPQHFYLDVPAVPTPEGGTTP